MLLELGPVPSDDVQQWARFVRRMICELRVDPADLDGVATTDFLDACTRLIDDWALDAVLGEPEFRWSQNIESEKAEYLLHGLDRCLHSAGLAERATPDELSAHHPFMMHVVQALVDGLTAEGSCHEQLCDQVRVSLGAALDH
jgi:hypothetical protein